MKNNKYKELRAKAKVVLQNKEINSFKENFKNIDSIVEELHIHQMELEMQNSELQKSIEKLQIEQQKYKQLYMDAPVAYFTINKTGNIINLNHAAAGLLGISMHAFSYGSIFPYLEKDSKIKFYKYFKQVYSSNVQQYSDVIFDTLKGEVYVNLSAVVYFDYDLKEKLVRCAATDQTQIKQYEKELEAYQNYQKTLKKYETVFSTTNAAIGLLSPNGFIIDCNAAFSAMLGYQGKEFVGTLVSDYVHSSFYELADKTLNALTPSNSQSRFSCQFLTKGGGIIWGDVTISAVFDDYGKMLYMVGVLIDVTEQKKHENQINMNNSRLHSLLEIAQSEDFDPDNFLKTALKAALKLARSDVGYISYKDIIDNEERIISLSDEQSDILFTDILDLTKHITRKNNSIFSHFKPFICNDIKKLSLQFKKPTDITRFLLVPLTEFSSTVAIVVVANKDSLYDEQDIIQLNVLMETLWNIKNRKEDEKIIRELNLQLEQANATKDRLFSVIGHDLRSQFTSIMGFSNLLSERIVNHDKEAMLRYTNIIKQSSETTYSLLESLLEWARAQSGDFIFNPLKLSLKEVFQECEEVYFQRMQSKRLECITQIDHDNIVADADMLKAIIRNLLSNAVKFSKNQGQIELKSLRNGSCVVISVTDNGVGMSQEIQDSLFDINDKSPQKGTEGEKGTGLGLLICKEFVEKHNGQITVESEVGKGTSFKVILPSSL